MKLKEIMTPSVEIVSPDCTLKDAAKLMKKRDIGALPVHDGHDRLSGMITDRDITTLAVAEGVDPNKKQVRDFMTTPIVYCYEDQEVDEGIRLMEVKQLRRLVILNRQKRLVGIVSLGDVARQSQGGSLTSEALNKISQPVTNSTNTSAA